MQTANFIVNLLTALGTLGATFTALWLAYFKDENLLRKFIPISIAARLLYEKIKDYTEALYVSPLSSSPNGKDVGVWRIKVCQDMLRQNVTIYGQKPPSKIYEVIDKEKLDRLAFGDDPEDNIIKEVNGQFPINPLYVNVAVKKRDLKKYYKKLQKEYLLDKTHPESTEMNQTKVIIRLPKADDLQPINVQNICQLVNQVYQKAEAGIWKENVERVNFQEMVEILQNQALLIAQMEAKLVGCVNVKLFNEDMAGFGMLATDQQFRNKGIGKKLIQAAEAWAINKGCRVMRLEILTPRNQLHPDKEFLKTWYTKMGYVLQSTEDFEELYPEVTSDLATKCDFIIYHKQLDK